MRIDTSAGCCIIKKVKKQYQILIIYRKWPDGREAYTLPKGHQKNNETLEETALRETSEETGYQNIKIIDKIGSKTYHLDMDNGIEKTDHFFIAEVKSLKTERQILTDSESNTGMKILWVGIDEAIDLITWPNEKETVEELKLLISEL